MNIAVLGYVLDAGEVVEYLLLDFALPVLTECGEAFGNGRPMPADLASERIKGRFRCGIFRPLLLFRRCAEYVAQGGQRLVIRRNRLDDIRFGEYFISRKSRWEFAH